MKYSRKISLCLDLIVGCNLQGTNFQGLENTTLTSNVSLACLDIYWVKMLSSFDQTR